MCEQTFSSRNEELFLREKQRVTCLGPCQPIVSEFPNQFEKSNQDNRKSSNLLRCIYQALEKDELRPVTFLNSRLEEIQVRIQFCETNVNSKELDRARSELKKYEAQIEEKKGKVAVVESSH